MLGQATPRAWLEDGKRIEIERAPTYYGLMNATIDSRSATGRITAEISMPDRSRPTALVVRLRHPQSKPIKSVTLNGRPWADFDNVTESVRIPQPSERRYTIAVAY